MKKLRLRIWTLKTKTRYKIATHHSKSNKASNQLIKIKKKQLQWKLLQMEVKYLFYSFRRREIKT